MTRRERGLTFTELLTTLAVAGIALSFALPGLNAGFADQRRATTINELIATLHLARSTAVTRNELVTVCPSDNGQNCASGGWERGWIVFADPLGTQTPDGEILVAGPPTESFTIRSDDFARFLTYRPTGQLMIDNAVENTGQFTICDDRGADAAKVIAVNASGKPVVGDHQVDGSAPRCPAS
ncbi:MAG: GspH/FimT family pseudopilin [Gammaproteobacteria bacterium]|nr:GspH/FimT family pseudopilin [Gammaproteobacteria bacterium]